MPDFTARITEILDEHRRCCLARPTNVVALTSLLVAAAEEHYRPRVETVEQLDALPEDVVVMFARGDVATKEPTRRDGWHWFRIGCYDSGPATDLDLPATVLWSPGAGE